MALRALPGLSWISVGCASSMCQDGKAGIGQDHAAVGAEVDVAREGDLARQRVEAPGAGGDVQALHRVGVGAGDPDLLPLPVHVQRIGRLAALGHHRQVEGGELALRRLVAQDGRFVVHRDPQIAVGIAAQAARRVQRRGDHGDLAAGRVDGSDLVGVQAGDPDLAVGRDVDAIGQRHAGRDVVDLHPVGDGNAPADQLEEKGREAHRQLFHEAAKRQVVEGEVVRAAVVHAHLVGQRQREPDAVLGVDAHRVRIEAAVHLVMVKPCAPDRIRSAGAGTTA